MTQDQIDPQAEIRAAVAGYFGGFLSDNTLDEVARVVTKTVVDIYGPPF